MRPRSVSLGRVPSGMCKISSSISNTDPHHQMQNRNNNRNNRIQRDNRFWLGMCQELSIRSIWGAQRMNGIFKAKLLYFLSPLSRLIPTKPELMKPTNVQQKCWGVVKCVHLCSLPNAVWKDGTFMLFSWYYLVGLHIYIHTYISFPLCDCCLCHSLASQQYYMSFVSFWVSFQWLYIVVIWWL